MRQLSPAPSGSFLSDAVYSKAANDAQRFAAMVALPFLSRTLRSNISKLEPKRASMAHFAAARQRFAAAERAFILHYRL